MSATPPAIWIGGLAASLAVHAGFAALIAASVSPDPVDQQEMPRTRLDMTSYEVPRSQARATEPASEAASPGQAEQTALSQDAIPRVAAIPRAPQSAVTAPKAAQATKLAAAPRPNPVELASPIQLGSVIPAAGIDAQKVPALLPDTPLAGLAETPSESLQTAIPATDRIARLAPEGAAVLSATPDSQRSKKATPTIQRLRDSGSRAEIEIAATNAPPGAALSVVTPTTLRSDVRPLTEDRLPDVSAVAAALPAVSSAGTILLTASFNPQRSEIMHPAGTALSASGLVSAKANTQAPAGDTLPHTRFNSGPARGTVAPDSPLTRPEPPAPEALARSEVPATVARQRIPPAATVYDSAAVLIASELPEAAPQASHVVAALAWSGDPNDTFDPVSFVAIQSFVTESDLQRSKSNAGSVRDGIASLLARVPCSRLQVAFDAETGSLELRGHLPEEGLREPVAAALQAAVGGSIPIRDNLRVLPRPQCGALAGISAAGLPQSTDQETDPRLVGESAHSRVYDYVLGDRMTFEMTAPDYDAYIYMDFFDAEGSVIHLVPNERVALARYDAKSIADLGKTGAMLDVTVGPPYGQEIAVAFASSVPLYKQTRPTVEPAEPYLDWLRAQITAARSAQPDFKGEWVYFFVSSSAGG